MELTKMELFKAMNDKHTNLKDCEGHSFDEYLDEQSAIDFWWMQEFSMNGDAYAGGSNYLYKRRDNGFTADSFFVIVK